MYYNKSNTYQFNLQKEKAYTKAKNRKPGIHNYGASNAEFFEDTNGVYNWVHYRDVWNFSYIGSTSDERVGYPTQKPIALLDLIIKASSNEQSMILDPFCGCATACIAAEMLGRQWVGIDISPKAADLVKLRMEKEVGIFYAGAHRTDIPQRTDVVPILPYHHKRNKEQLYGTQGGHCNGCREHFETRHLEIDHIVPRSKGGTDHLENLQLLCGSCNRIKGNRTHEFLISALNDKSLINLAA
ncbi:MAG: DNA methyltransferase [Gammaproteobacteria bacterium]|nr:DNA methyltransferase [Gammaproteobacteria bacterium]